MENIFRLFGTYRWPRIALAALISITAFAHTNPTVAQELYPLEDDKMSSLRHNLNYQIDRYIQDVKYRKINWPQSEIGDFGFYDEDWEFGNNIVLGMAYETWGRNYIGYARSGLDKKLKDYCINIIESI